MVRALREETMGLWKITNKGPRKVLKTRFREEKLLEEHLEDWIVSDSSMLGEPLLVLGRQVIVPDTKDRLDVLAVDPRGAMVIIELKRGVLKDPVDIQALRYASYISKWKMSWRERLHCIFRGYVWVHILSGITQYPMSVHAEETIFNEGTK